MEAGDVVGLRERAHEDHVLLPSRPLDRFLDREDDRALGGSRRGGHAVRQDLVLAGWIECRVHQRVELVRLDALDRLLL
jgi:hypothetical protein